MDENQTLEKRIATVKSYEATKQTWRKNYDSIEFKAANKLNQELFGERLERKPGCECVEIFFFNLNHQYKTKEKIKIMANKKFILKPGKVVMNHNFPEPLDNNASDEDFIKLLSINPKAISLFEKYPDEWEKLAKNFNPLKKDEDQTKDTAEDPTKLRTVAEFEAFAAKHNIDISSASNKDERLALIREGLEAKTKNPVDEDSEEAKADKRFHDRAIQLEGLGYVVDKSADTFTKGEHVISGRDVYEGTDEEFANLLPTE